MQKAPGNFFQGLFSFIIHHISDIVISKAWFALTFLDFNGDMGISY